MALASTVSKFAPLFLVVPVGDDLPTTASLNLKTIPHGAVCVTYNVGPPISIAETYIYWPEPVGWQPESLPA